MRKGEIRSLQQKVQSKIGELLELRGIVSGWIIAATKEGDEESVREYEADLARLDILIEDGNRHIAEGQILIDDSWWRHWMQDMAGIEREMKADILVELEEELAEINGMIAVLEATEPLSEEQMQQLEEYRKRKQALELEITKYQ